MKLSDIRSAMPRSKNAYDRIGNPAAYYIARPLSFWVTWILYSARVSANAVSWAATCTAIVACIVAVASAQPFIVGGLCLLWLVLDCVDGNLARISKGGSKYGEFLDALSGYILAAGMPVSLTAMQGGSIALMGAVGGMLTLLSRLLLNKANVLSSQGRDPSGDTGGGMLAAIFLSFYNLSGVGLVLLVLAMLTRRMDLYVALQCVLGFAATAAAIRKARIQLH